MMVPLDSARQWYPREKFVACNADHSQIAKLKRGENSIYPSVRWAIKKGLFNAGDLYSEAEGTLRADSGLLESVDEASSLRQSLLQVSHRPSSTTSDDPSAGSALLSPTHPTGDNFNQQIKRLHRIEIDRSGHTKDSQSKTRASSRAVAQWQPGEVSSQQDDTSSSMDPSGTAETEVTLYIQDEDGSTIKTAKLTTSLDTETTTRGAPSKEADSDHLAIERNVNGIAAVQQDESSSMTEGTKSMIMDKEIASAIIEGDEQKTRDLLEHSYDIECKDEDERTPLLLAARYRRETIVKLLLEEGANPREKCSIRSEKTENSFKGYTVLHLLARYPGSPISEAFVDLIWRYLPTLDASTNHGETPLMIACRSGELLLAARLIHHGANVRAVDCWGDTPLHHAVFNGNEACVATLLQSGVDINASNRKGYKSLHVAAEKDQPGIVKALLAHGADSNAEIPYDRYSINEGWTSLHLAVVTGQLENIKILLDHGANPMIKTNGLLGSRPSAMNMKKGVSFTQKKAVRDVLKEAEKAWKQSGKK